MPSPTSRDMAFHRADFESVCGRPFEHFYCPLLYRDEPVALCEGHILNRAFYSAARTTVIQREDIDGWYGSMFEAEWVLIQERGQHTLPEILSDMELRRKLKPQFWVDGRRVDYYVAGSNPVPKEHSPVIIEEVQKPLQFVMKIDPAEVNSNTDARWEVSVERDLRLSALVSLLKAAHLTLFHLFGYRYVFSPGGRLLGHEALGRFFAENVGRPKREVLKNARAHFAEYVSIVRPLLRAPSIEGTLSDRVFGICMPSRQAWALLVFVKAAEMVHSILVPTFERPDDIARYLRFLKAPFPRFHVSFGQYRDTHWSAWKGTERVIEWPAAAFNDTPDSHAA